MHIKLQKKYLRGAKKVENMDSKIIKLGIYSPWRDWYDSSWKASTSGIRFWNKLSRNQSKEGSMIIYKIHNINELKKIWSKEVTKRLDRLDISLGKGWSFKKVLKYSVSFGKFPPIS